MRTRKSTSALKGRAIPSPLQKVEDTVLEITRLGKSGGVSEGKDGGRKVT